MSCFFSRVTSFDQHSAHLEVLLNTVVLVSNYAQDCCRLSCFANYSTCMITLGPRCPVGISRLEFGSSMSRIIVCLVSYNFLCQLIKRTYYGDELVLVCLK